ncbi:hypothetical protein ACNPQM_36390 [Streptomyces sp. NPDC056231]|uniref:hypothetical protein n=1 Tax=Streptomyces sp. NPDC056231 TaxID=3345755 RepID=UPI003AAAE3FD
MGITPPKSTTDQPISEEVAEEPAAKRSDTGSGTAATASGAGSTSPSDAASASADRHSLRGALVVGGAMLAACAGLILYGVLDTSKSDDTAEHRVPAAPVTYEVTGEGIADITYQALQTSGKATVAKAATLPWRTTVDVPLDQDPIVNIVLTQQGGQARCTLAIRGQHIQSATATGAFGRATCTSQFPHQEPPES